MAQEASGVILDASPQLFSVLYALRAAGIAPLGAPPDSSPVLELLERSIERLPPEARASLQAFFEEKHPQGRAVDLSPYISLALVVGPPPTFTLTLPDDHIPPDAYPLKDFLPQLRDFYQRADLAGLWSQVHPFYQQAVAERHSGAANLLLATRGYLRVIEGSYPGRSYFVYLDWLVPPGLTNARNYGERYYLVIHPRHDDFFGALRHQYLHFLLDPVTAKYADDISPLARLQSLAERAPRLAKVFRQDTLLLVTESLIRAVELRLQKLETAAAARLDEGERSGYLFIRHFFQALERFEQEEPSIRYYFPELLSSYDVDQEWERLAALEFLPPVPVIEERLPLPEESISRLLAEAEAYMAEGDYAAARGLFEQVLEQAGPNQPGALYGLALLASIERKPEPAKRYFLRTLEEARTPHILGWTHIYLGRIYDLEGDRQQALSHYRAALALNTRLQRIDQAARRGLEQAFGQREKRGLQEQEF